MEDEEVAESVLGYLSEHPQAMDTAEGIAQWWLLRQQVRVNIGKLTRVLRRLADKGLLEELGGGEQRRYRRKDTAEATAAVSCPALPTPCPRDPLEKKGFRPHPPGDD